MTCSCIDTEFTNSVRDPWCPEHGDEPPTRDMAMADAQEIAPGWTLTIFDLRQP